MPAKNCAEFSVCIPNFNKQHWKLFRKITLKCPCSFNDPVNKMLNIYLT